MRSSGDACNYFPAPSCTFPSKPVVDTTKLDSVYSTAAPGPGHGCGTYTIGSTTYTSTGTAPTFDTNGTRSSGGRP